MASEYPSTTSQLFANASQALAYASMSAGRIAASTKPALLNPGFEFSITDKNFGAAPKFSDVFANAENRDANVGALNDQVDAWLAKYFPAINAGFKSVPEDYLVGVIGGTKPFGIDKTVFDLVWEQARDRIYRTTRTEQRTLEATFSSRGFTLPPGALVDALAETERRATADIISVVRDQALKDAELKADILKHAVGIAAQLKQAILNTSAEFFKSYYQVYNLGNETAKIRAEAYRAYYQALSAFQNVEVNWEELRLRAAVEKANIALGADRNKIGLYGGGDGAPAAHAQAARGFADIAANANAAAGSLVAQIETV